MPGTSKKTRMVGFRMTVECYAKIQDALKTYANQNTSVGDYCKDVVERYAFRHDPNYKKNKLAKTS